MQSLIIRLNRPFSTRPVLCRYKEIILINGIKSIGEIIENFQNEIFFRKVSFRDSEFGNIKNLLLLKDLNKCMLYFLYFFISFDFSDSQTKLQF